MKINFSTDDLETIKKCLWHGVNHTDRMFEPVFNTEELWEYRNAVLEFRAKVFAILEIEDPNSHVIEMLKKFKPKIKMDEVCKKDD